MAGWCHLKYRKTYSNNPSKRNKCNVWSKPACLTALEIKSYKLKHKRWPKRYNAAGQRINIWPSNKQESKKKKKTTSSTKKKTKKATKIANKLIHIDLSENENVPKFDVLQSDEDKDMKELEQDIHSGIDAQNTNPSGIYPSLDDVQFDEIIARDNIKQRYIFYIYIYIYIIFHVQIH